MLHTSLSYMAQNLSLHQIPVLVCAVLLVSKFFYILDIFTDSAFHTIVAMVSEREMSHDTGSGFRHNSNTVPRTQQITCPNSRVVSAFSNACHVFTCEAREFSCILQVPNIFVRSRKRFLPKVYCDNPVSETAKFLSKLLNIVHLFVF